MGLKLIDNILVVGVFCSLSVFWGSELRAQENKRLKDLSPFPFGAAVNVRLLKSNLSYRTLVIKEFNSLTPESAMKFKTLHPNKETYNWNDADYLIDFAKKNGKRVHGHTLIWDGSVPEWVNNFEGDSTAFENMVKDHITTVVKHFKGQIKSWDVVNEAIDDDGTYIKNIWYKKLGKDYIARCFVYAHQADPGAMLFYNDHSTEASPSKRKSISKLIENLKLRGIPINGLGLQMHTRIAQSDDGINEALMAAASTELQVHISELDISIKTKGTLPSVFTSNLQDIQANKYKFIFSSYNNVVPKSQQFGVTMWNVSDKDSWLTKSKLKPNWPTLFDTYYKQKKGYMAIQDYLKALK